MERYPPWSLHKKQQQTHFLSYPNCLRQHIQFTKFLNIQTDQSKNAYTLHMRFTKGKQISSLCVWGISFQGHIWIVGLLHRHSFSLNSVNIPKTYSFPLYFAGGKTSKKIAREWCRGKRPLAIQWELTQSGKAQPSLIFREADLEAGSCKRPDKAKAAEMIPKTERESHNSINNSFSSFEKSNSIYTQITGEFCLFIGNAHFFYLFFLYFWVVTEMTP